MSVLFAITLSYGLQQNQSSKALDTLFLPNKPKDQNNCADWSWMYFSQMKMMNLVQYIFDFNKSVDSTAQMASSTEMTLLDVQTIAKTTVCAPLYPAVCILFTHFLKSKNVFSKGLFLKILALCMVSIQERFLIKSGL